MLAYIKGTVEQIGEDFVVVENNGMGYLIKTPGSVTREIQKLHQQVTIYTYMHVREDEISLFGFLTRDALELFKLLITVNGVGPKVANAVLTALSEDELRMAVLSGDVKAITRANGLGAKGAQRIIMELKDKIALDDMLEGADQDGFTGENAQTQDASVEASMALVSLGYSNTEALRAIKALGDTDGMSAEDIIKLALKKLI